jgi:hypothetical protein
MRHRSRGLRWLGVLVLAAASCHSGVPDLKPPKGPDEYVLPPPDPRFSQPVTPPREKFQDDFFKSKLDGDPQPPGLGRPQGGGAGMGPGRF